MPLLDKAGVKIRADGQGDGWANQHRELGQTFNMQDLDGFFGLYVFAKNSANSLFLEYAPDRIENREKVIRRFAVVALFDRKKTEDAALSDMNIVSTAFYLWTCRQIGDRQPIAPRFFYVIGDDNPPWTMIELNIASGERLGCYLLTGYNWRDVWEVAGLRKIRDELRRWVQG